MEDNDAQLQLKKRARRRLVGAVFFASLVALVLPLLMDHDPRAPVQDLDIRIPGQDAKPFTPNLAPVEPQPAPAASDPGRESLPAEQAPPAVLASKPPAVAAPARLIDPPVAVDPSISEKTTAQSSIPGKPVVKASPRPEAAEPSVALDDEARRAAAILAGRSPDAKAPLASASGYLILIGAFSNEANVRNLKTKLGEQGIKVFTEPLNTPQGQKTRVRAGPFPSREAAEAALKKMQRIGVSGVVSAKP